MSEFVCISLALVSLARLCICAFVCISSRSHCRSSLSLVSLSLSCLVPSNEKRKTRVVTCGLTESEAQVAVECATRSSTSVLGRMAEIAEVLCLLESFFLGGGAN